MSWTGLYTFDEADAALTLLPMAARRALDLAGIHLSLSEWKELGLPQRRALVAQGAREQVDLAAVALAVASVPTRAEPRSPDPDIGTVPAVVVEALGAARPLSLRSWQSLRALDRYVLVKLASRGRQERLLLAYDEVLGPAR